MHENTIPYRPVEVQLDAQTQTIDPGGQVTVPFTVISHAGRADLYDIMVEGIPLNWVTLDLPSVQLADGEQRAASLKITAPEGSPLAAGTYPVSIRAVSRSDVSVQAENGFNLQMGAYEESTRVMPPYQQSGSVGLRIDASQFTVTPGDTLSIPVVVINQGAYDETFHLSVDGISPDWVSLPVAALRLMPGEAREVAVLLQPPPGPTGRAGRHTFRIRAASQSDPSQVAEADAVLTVAVITQFTSDLNPRHLQSGRLARLRIHNLSNIPETFEVLFQSHGQELEFVPVTAGPVHVMPGETVAYDFAVSPVRPTWLGGATQSPYTVLVRGSSGETQAHTGEVISRSLIPVWMLPAMAVLCLTAVCGLSLLWNFNQDRLTQATETAEAQVAMLEAGTATAAYHQTEAALNGQQDTDGDGLTDQQEQELGTNPLAADTDNDRISDGDEVRLGLNYLNPDTDGDGLVDGLDFSPLDPTNPLLTATAQASLPTLTVTSTITPTLVVPTATQPAPTSTFTAQPSATTPPIAEASPTSFPLPVTGQQGLGFVVDGDLYLLNSDETAAIRLTNDPAIDFQPAWSPDGQRIAFTSNRDGNNEIYVMNADGSDLTNLTQNPANDRDPAWSPDGEQIAFTTDREGNSEVYRVNLDGSDPVNLTSDPSEDIHPAWYTDSGLFGSTSQILFVSDRDGNEEVYAVNPDGSDLTNLTQHDASDTQPSVSPEGGLVVFVSDRDGSPDVFTMQPDGSDPTNLTQHESSDTAPAVSPDGEWVAFISDRGGQVDIYVLPIGGGTPAHLTQNPAQESGPVWR